jgi:GNAT superfamily N-acetyltransferase
MDDASGRGDVIVRVAEQRDLAALGRMGALLMRTHYAFDRLRFLAPGESPEQGYAAFLGGEIGRDDVCVFVAEDGTPGRVIGYVYAGVEPMSWRELRGEVGFVHDLVVSEEARGQGVGGRLLERAIDWLRESGMPRVVLWAAEPNQSALRLFASHGFRRTMIEMTREVY